ncbi:hypothetical protein B4N89_16790 [Embleya scabrispora]|uniref:PknH-like extracellular domain-containing protein n=1 Tax=Embleya scabrispora TaxID=159449 RepID=A0A1T3P045_9ACTN|nr:hypothetical protein [Embleya scabrispora]OPC82374.1 hypothetical protein B4N89_16790 [Embleya scabrispora]
MIRLRPLIRPRPRAFTGLLTIVLLTTATACDGAAESIARDASPRTPGVTATPTPSARKTAPDAAPRLSAIELKRLLVGETDLPAGWISVFDNDQGDEKKAESTGCERLSMLMNPSSGVYPVLGAASIVARKPAPGGKSYALAGSALTSLSADDAQRIIPAIRDLLPRCPDERYEREGMFGRVTTREIARPRLGDDSMGIEIVTRVEDTGQAWAHSIVLVRVGSTLIRVTYVNLTGATPQPPGEALLRKQVDLVTAATPPSRS